MPSAAPSYWLPKVRVHSAGRNRAEERDLPARQGFGRRNPRRQMDPSEVDTRHQHDLAPAGATVKVRATGVYLIGSQHSDRLDRDVHYRCYFANPNQRRDRPRQLGQHKLPG